MIMKVGNMYETKDPAIKLFGMKIPVPDPRIPAMSQVTDSCCEITKADDGPHAVDCAKDYKSSASRDCKEEHQTSMTVNEVQVDSKPKEDEAGNDSTDQEKVFKKPDKVVPCPRCNSLDTKFCYFNNYNVNQPRHFCKNCQRYWTAGGTMRNVPVGAGRRKNKHLASQYGHVLLSSDGVPTATIESPDLANHQLLSYDVSATAFRPSTGNGTVIKFGPETPLCESIETLLNLKDQKRCVEIGSVSSGEIGEEPCVSSMTASSTRENELPENVMQKEQVGLLGSCNQLNPPHPMHYPVPPWVFPLNPGWNNAASSATVHHSSERVCVPDSSYPNPVQWCPTPMLAVPGFCPQSIPLQFIPASYWGCMPPWAAGTGTMSMTGSNGCLSPTSSTSNSFCSSNGSPILGKHSRDSNFMDKEKSGKCILVPKTLRIDDPDEASRSPIWTTLGIKSDQKGPILKGNIFKAFEPKSEGKSHILDGSQILEANPASLFRSQTFQEST